MKLAAILLSLICVGCATAPSTTPRAYLDERSAATITVVADPWIFSRERTLSQADQRDFLNIYAIDVNRQGDHRQYLAVLQSRPLLDDQGRQLPTPQLELRVDQQVLVLEPSLSDPRELGVTQPVAESYSMSSTWWYYPIRKQTLAEIAGSRQLQATLFAGDVQAPYVLWRDGQAAASALAEAIP